MKTVTQAFTDAWNQKFNAGKCFVYYKRRYWNGSAFAYEANWTQITMREYARVGNIVWRLDTPLLNTIRASNVTISLRNNDWQWVPENKGGVFAADAAQAGGYEPFLTQFQVRFGYKKADGTWELVNLFTGVLVDLTHDTERGWSEAIVSGNEYLLQATTATNVGTAFTTQNLSPATGDGSNKVFTTTQKGVAQDGFSVTVAGAAQNQGRDYTTAGFSVYNGVVTVTMTNAPANGAAMKCSGTTWYTLSRIETLITYLTTAAGVTVGQIAAVTFPGVYNGVTNLGQFSGTNYGAAWTTDYNNSATIAGSAGVLSVATTGQNTNAGLHATGSGAANYTGIWSWTSKLIQSQAIAGNASVYFIMNNANLVGGAYSGAGYAIVITDDGYGHGVAELIRQDSNISATVLATYLQGTTTPIDPRASHVWTVTRAVNGDFSVFVDGIIIMTATDASHNDATDFVVAVATGSVPGATVTFTITGITWTQAVTLTMADFSGMTCFDAIQKLAAFADYEWGFDGSGSFFFRPKAVSSTTVLSISDNDKISKVTEFRSGWDLLVNDAQVTYNTYFAEYNSGTLPEAAPTSQQRYLTQLKAEDDSALLIVYDAGIAQGRAQLLHDNNYKAKRRCKVASRIMPQLDLSDVIGVSFLGRYLKRGNVFGDPLQSYGDASFGTPRTDVLCIDMAAKVIGMTLNPNACTGEYEVQEVLS